MEKLLSKVDKDVEKELRHHFKPWFKLSDELKFAYDIRSWGKKLGMDSAKIERAIKIAKYLKKRHMGSNP